MAHLNIHPAPGLGELIPGWFVVPNNPFQPRQPVARTVGVGELIAAHWTLPQNPLATLCRPSGCRRASGRAKR